MTHTRLAPVLALALALALLAAATGGVVAARPAAVVAPGAAAGAVGDDTCACEDYQCDCKKKIEFNKHLETTLDASFALVPSTNTSDAGFANVTLSADGKEKVTVPFISAAKAEDPGLACFTVAKVARAHARMRALPATHGAHGLSSEAS